MIFVYFIRHLPSAANIKNLWCGQASNLSIDLSRAKQMKEDGLLDNILNINFDYIYSSPLKRCIETYEFLGFDKKQVILDKRLLERNFGEIEQTPCDDKTKQILADFDLNTDLDKHIERIQDLYYKRLLPFLDDIKKLPDNSKVLILSHSWIGRLLKFYFTKNKNDIYVAPKNGELLFFKCNK